MARSRSDDIDFKSNNVRKNRLAENRHSTVSRCMIYPTQQNHRPMVSGDTIIERLAYVAVTPVRERCIFFQRIPQYVEVLPNIEAKRIISCFSAAPSQ
jgi:hypothetical protein